VSNQTAARRSLVEAVFILASILVAFSIDAWWDERQALATESAVLAELSLETERNRALLDATLATGRNALDRIDRFLRASPEELAQLPRDSVSLFIAAFAVPNTFDPEVAAAEVLADLAVLNTRGLTVRTLAAQWLRALADTEEEKDGLISLTYVGPIWERLAVQALPEAAAGLTAMSQMNSRIGPEGLALVRRRSLSTPLRRWTAGD